MDKGYFVSIDTMDTADVLRTLVEAPSISPSDAGLITLMASWLRELGFSIKRLDSNGVCNLVAKLRFGEGPNIAYSGHVDVVHANADDWNTDPFRATIIDNRIFGRGTADMKGSIAAMYNATRSLIEKSKQLKGTFYWLLTSDEEGEAENGSKVIAQYLEQNNIKLNACLIGEPTSCNRVGDIIRNGRRGSISGSVTVTGKSGHVAYPEHISNSAHQAAQVITTLVNLRWPQDNDASCTGVQITGLSSSTDIDNISPQYCTVNFNVRYSHLYTAADVTGMVATALADAGETLHVEWSRACEPYYNSSTGPHSFLNIVESAIFECTGKFPVINTAGGSSDGRFFAKNCSDVIECGVRNDTIHQNNENLPITDLQMIEDIYFAIIEKAFSV